MTTRSRIHQTFHKNSPSARFAILVGLLLFAPYTFIRIWLLFSPTMPLELVSGVPIAGLGLWQFLLSWLLFSQPMGYWVACGSVVILSTWAATTASTTKLQRAGLVLTLAMTLYFMVGPYRPAVQVVAGQTMVVPTAPSFFLRGLRNAQAMGEVTPCRYELLGWQGEVLFYQSQCTLADKQIWQLAPEKTQKPREYLATLPSDLYRQQITHKATLAQVSAAGVSPVEAEPSVRSLYVPDAGYLSPDGKWVALLARHLYAVEDVLVLKADYQMTP